MKLPELLVLARQFALLVTVECSAYGEIESHAAAAAAASASGTARAVQDRGSEEREDGGVMSSEWSCQYMPSGEGWLVTLPILGVYTQLWHCRPCTSISNAEGRRLSNLAGLRGWAFR